MHPDVKALFELTRSSVTKRHIRDFAPADPGYDSYVQKWTRIYQTGVVPQESEFDLSEVIGLTGWATEKCTVRFRQFRRFTSAVAVALIESGNDCDCVRGANYLARDLIIDTDVTEREHFSAVRKVFPVMRETLLATNYEEEYPFYSLGAMVLAHRAEDFSEMSSLAIQLKSDETAVRANESLNWSVVSDQFLFGLTNYDLLNRDWLRLASELTNPDGDDNVQFVLDSLAKPNV